MALVELVLQLPDDVARRARDAGLLEAERIAELIEREVALETELLSPGLRPENNQLLAFLDQWMSEPSEQNAAWWDALESDMASNRFTLAVRSP